MLQNFLIHNFLKALKKLEYGTLVLTKPDGKTHTFKGKKEGPRVSFSFQKWSVIKNLIINGDIGFVQDYQSGLWDTDNLPALLELSLLNENSFERYVKGSAISRFLTQIFYWFQRNTIANSKKNIEAHYDLGNDFYALWLDPSMTYSSALFRGKDMALEKAQHNKYKRILEQLTKKSGTFLEIGCGWGGMAENVLKHGKYQYKGLTLSNEQHDYAQKRIGQKGEVALEDYRIQTGTYDHIVSIEMFEAVGEQYWPTYFEKIKELLDKDGRAVVQTITIEDHRFEGYKRGADMIRSYIFPGGMLPSPSRFQEEMQKAGLKAINTLAFGQDYAHTLLEWLGAFDKNKAAIQTLGFDDKFIKLWRFYLSACYAGFKTGRTDVMQVTMEHYEH